MKIGIDISQTAFANTGVSSFLTNLITRLSRLDKKNQYILFYSSLRKGINNNFINLSLENKNIVLKQFRLPPFILDVLWNRLHIMPVEKLIGDVDIFISSDWTEPPAIKAKKMTILYDLVIYKYPKESAKIIVDTQKRKLKWTKKECAVVICISESTKKDANDILGIEKKRLKVIYPGI